MIAEKETSAKEILTYLRSMKNKPKNEIIKGLQSKFKLDKVDAERALELIEDEIYEIRKKAKLIYPHLVNMSFSERNKIIEDIATKNNIDSLSLHKEVEKYIRD